MEEKTQVNAEKGKQEILITRHFDLPVELLFEAFCKPEWVGQWMGNKVIKLESRKHGSFEFQVKDPNGNAIHFNGVIHEFRPNEKMIRTFEMENMPFGVQLEILEFEKLGANTSKLHKKVIYESVAKRDENLKLPFAKGINQAHDRLQNFLESTNT